MIDNQTKEEIDVQRKVLGTVNNHKKLTEDEMLALSCNFILAGFETTASTLTCAAYELALHQEIQERIVEELSSVVDINNDIDYEQLMRLPYLDAVVCETLRKHSFVVKVNRITSQEYWIQKLGLILPAGQVVEIPIYALHHNPKYWPNPNKFDPDRFMPANRDKIVPYTFIPFLAGPRNCVGMRFALMEVKLALAQVMLRYRFYRTQKTDLPLKLRSGSLAYSAKRVFVSTGRRA